LKYLSWCPRVKSAAGFIPDREFPTKRVKQVSMVGGVILLTALIYNVVAPPRNYSWDLDFKNAEYDEVYQMYAIKRRVILRAYTL